jgi:hypothetical protein
MREAAEWLRRYERFWSGSLDRPTSHAARKEAEVRILSVGPSILTAVVEASIDHLRRYIELLFRRPKRKTGRKN